MDFYLSAKPIDFRTILKVGLVFQEKDVLNTVWISCQGESDVDKKHIPADKISYFPSQGIPGYYFPFLNQKSYLSPFVMVALDIPETSSTHPILT
jgi:hypothetical protein